MRKNELYFTISKRYQFCCIVLVLLLTGVSAMAQDCPAANAFSNFAPWSGAMVTTSQSGSTVTYSAGSTSNLLANTGDTVPGIIALCVYSSSTDLSKGSYAFDGPSSTDTAGTYSFVAVVGKGHSVFKRPYGDPSDVPMDGNQHALGDATYATLPSVTGYLLHINDQALCDQLYGGTSNTCFVDPDGDPPPPRLDWPLQGFKYYDANANGVYDAGDTIISGWPMRNIGNSPMFDPAVPEMNYPTGCDPLTAGSCQYFTAVANTDGNGEFQFAHLTAGGTYGVCEAAGTASGYNWAATTQRPIHSNGSTSWETQIFCPRHVQPSYGSVPLTSNEPLNTQYNSYACWSSNNTYDGVDQNISSIPVPSLGGYVNIAPGRGPAEFGNLCTAGLKGGLTLGFWSNKNGAKAFQSCGSPLSDLQTLLWLRNPNGSRFVPGTYAQFQSWLTSSNASSMSNQMSVQMATMYLNIKCSSVTGPYGGGGINGNALVYAPGTYGANNLGYVSLTGLVTAANSSAQFCSDANGNSVSSPTTTCYDATASTVRTYQGLLQTYLNALNNKGGNVVQTGSQAAACIAATTFGDCTPADITNVETGVDKGLGFIPPQ